MRPCYQVVVYFVAPCAPQVDMQFVQIYRSVRMSQRTGTKYKHKYIQYMCRTLTQLVICPKKNN